MSEIVEFPFDSGAYEAADRKWLGGAMLRVAENARLDRDGRLVHRPGATALSSGTMSANALVPYDLGNYQGRLVALGSQRSTGTGIQDLFEWVAAAGKWRATSGEDTNSSTGQRVPTLTNVREVGAVPDQGGTVRHVSLACGAGYVCAVIARATESTIHVFEPTTNQTLLLVDVDMRLARVVYAGSDFWIYGVDADEDIVRCNFDPVNDETISSISTLLSNATTVTDLAVSTFGTGSAVAWCTASSAVIRTYSSAGAFVATWTGLAAAAEAVALVGNVAGTLLTLCYQDASFEYFATTFNAAGAVQSGPTSLFGGAGGSGARLGACLQSNGTSISVVGTNDSTRLGLLQTLIQSTHGTTATVSYADARPECGPVATTNEEFSGWVDMIASNASLGTFHVVGNRQLPQCFLGAQLIEEVGGPNRICNGATAGTKVYMAYVQLAENTGIANNSLRATIIEASADATQRRQMAKVAGELLISGGLPLTYDGRTMGEIGFAECPIVLFSSTATNGSLTQLTTYQVKAVWKCYNGQNLVARSQPSPPLSQTLTGADDAISWLVTTPHSLRRHRAFRDQSLTVVVELYRTIGNGANFQLDVVQAIDVNDDSAAPVTLTSSRSDTSLSDNAVIYSDESGLEISAPFPFSYVSPARDRAFAGGTPDAATWLMSDLLIPGRQVSFAFAKAAYTQRANQAITAVAAFEQVGLVWSQDEIQQVPGRGPERSGTGEFDSMIGVPTPGGCIDWRSVIVAPPGAFFQMATDKLMLLARAQTGAGAGEVSWVGQPVRETLAAFPVITAAVHIRSQMAVAFACNAADGLSGRILIYDLRRSLWFVDNVGGPVSALAELDGRLVWLSSGVIYQQDAAPGTGTFISLTLESGLVRIKEALGWGRVYKIGLLGTAAGPCTLQALIDYDDGAGFVSLGSETFAGTEGAFERFWSLANQKASRFAVKFIVTHASTGSAGLQLNGWAAQVDGSKNMVRVGSTGQVA